MQFIEALIEYRLGLLHHLTIKHGQQSGPVQRGILHQQDDPHHGLGCIKINIHPVLSTLDYCKHDIGITAPDIGVVKTGLVETFCLVYGVPNRVSQ